MPKQESIWELTQMNDRYGSPVLGVMNTARFISTHGFGVIFAIMAIFVTLEFGWSRWPQYRGGTITILTAFISAAILAAITSLAIVTMVVVPYAIEKQ